MESTTGGVEKQEQKHKHTDTQTQICTHTRVNRHGDMEREGDVDGCTWAGGFSFPVAPRGVFSRLPADFTDVCCSDRGRDARAPRCEDGGGGSDGSDGRTPPDGEKSEKREASSATPTSGPACVAHPMRCPLHAEGEESDAAWEVHHKALKGRGGWRKRGRSNRQETNVRTKRKTTRKGPNKTRQPTRGRGPSTCKGVCAHGKEAGSAATDPPFLTFSGCFAGRAVCGASR